MLQFKLSAGEFFELIRPATLIVSAIVSTWVLFSAQKRYRSYFALLWAIAAFLFPLIATPVYLLTLIFIRKPSLNSGGWARKFGVPLLYGLLALAAIWIYLRKDVSTVDSHLARANQARVNNDRPTTIREYREALALENNAHTHKLLAIELADAGQFNEALSEFRLAAEGGEPDATIHYRMAELLEKLDRNSEAKSEYDKFSASQFCSGLDKDPRCAIAQAKVAAGKSR